MKRNTIGSAKNWKNDNNMQRMSALQNKSVLESFFDILKNEQNHWNLLLCCQWFWFFIACAPTLQIQKNVHIRLL